MAILGIRLLSGTQVEAPIEEWMSALLSTFTDVERARICQRIEENRARGASWHSVSGKAIATPRKGYILEAEPGIYRSRLI